MDQYKIFKNLDKDLANELLNIIYREDYCLLLHLFPVRAEA